MRAKEHSWNSSEHAVIYDLHTTSKFDLAILLSVGFYIRVYTCAMYACTHSSLFLSVEPNVFSLLCNC